MLAVGRCCSWGLIIPVPVRSFFLSVVGLIRVNFSYSRSFTFVGKWAGKENKPRGEVDGRFEYFCGTITEPGECYANGLVQIGAKDCRQKSEQLAA